MFKLLLIFIIFFVFVHECHSAPRSRSSTLKRNDRLDSDTNEDEEYYPDNDRDNRESVGDIISRFWRSFRKLWRSGNLGNFLSNVNDQFKSLVNTVFDRDLLDTGREYRRRDSRARDKENEDNKRDD